MQRIPPKILLIPNAALLTKSSLLLNCRMLRAMSRRIQIPFRLLECFRMINDFVEERIRVEEEDGRVVAICCKVLLEGGEAVVLGCDGTGMVEVFGASDVGGSLDWGDVEEEEVSGAGVIELVGLEGSLEGE